MKKIVNGCSVIGITMAYLLILGKAPLTENEALFLIRFVGEIIRMVLSVATFFIIYSKQNKELMNPLKKEGYYIAFMHLIFGVVILIGINCYILEPHKIEHMCFDFYKQALECLQVGMLVAMTGWYEQDKDTKKIVYLMWGAMSLVILFVIFDIDVIENVYWTTGVRCLIRVVTIMMIVVVGYLYYRKKNAANLFMRRMFLALLAFKAIINGIDMVRVLIDDVLIALLQYILQIVFMMWMISCMNEYTYKTSWAKMEFEIADKNRKRKKIEYNQELLNMAVKKIKGCIQKMVVSLESLENQLEHKENQKKYIHKMKDNCLKLYELSSQILKPKAQQYNKENFIFENTNLYEYIKSLIEAIEPYVCEKGLSIEFWSNQHNIMANVHKQSIERIVFNLISNAVKYNKKGGKIRVTLSQRKKWIYFCVQDSGIGIAESERATIFEKYARSKNSFTQKQEGSGLGLNNVKALVEKHNGEIKIGSQEEKGTIVCIKLPTVYRTEIKDKQELKQAVNQSKDAEDFQ